MAARKTNRKKRRSKVTPRKRSAAPPRARRNLAQVFQEYFDGGLDGKGPIRDACCHRIAEMLGGRGVPLGPGLQQILHGHFGGATPEQGAQLAGWPDDQLQLFLHTLAIGLRCPGIPGGGPFRKNIDPVPPRSYPMRFRARPVRGASPRLEVGIDENGIDITFIDSRIA